MKNENLQKAAHDVGFLLESLQSSISTASPVEFLIILPLVERAAGMKRDIELLICAMNNECKDHEQN